MMKLTCVLVIALAAIGTYAEDPDRLVRGIDTSIDQYPFAVSMRIKGTHFCGGAIIGKRFIITAAHCLQPIKGTPIMSEMTVVTGTSTLNRGGEVHQVEDVYYHPSYTPNPNGGRAAGYDLGLVKLTKDIVFSNVQQPVPLPECAMPMQPGSIVTVVAWGTTYFRGPVSNILQKLDARYMNPTQCQMYHKYLPISPLEFCTFVAPSIGTCQGDSGSGVVQNGRVVGVVSGGLPCAQGVPDIKTNICALMSWVRTIVH